MLKQVRRSKLRRGGVFFVRNVGIPQVKEWLWLSIGASFGDGDFQDGIYPSYGYVDYVRVWRSFED